MNSLQAVIQQLKCSHSDYDLMFMTKDEFEIDPTDVDDSDVFTKLFLEILLSTVDYKIDIDDETYTILVTLNINIQEFLSQLQSRIN